MPEYYRHISRGLQDWAGLQREVDAEYSYLAWRLINDRSYRYKYKYRRKYVYSGSHSFLVLIARVHGKSICKGSHGITSHPSPPTPDSPARRAQVLDGRLFQILLRRRRLELRIPIVKQRPGHVNLPRHDPVRVATDTTLALFTSRHHGSLRIRKGVGAEGGTYSPIHAYGLSGCVLSFSSRFLFKSSFVPMFVSLGFFPYTSSNFSAISKVLILSPRTGLGVSKRHQHLSIQGLGSLKRGKRGV